MVDAMEGSSERRAHMKAIVWLTLLVVLPRAVVGQDARRERLRQALPEAAPRIEALVADAEAAGVPSAPLIDKALEGAAKRVPAERVIAVVADYARRLGDAQAAVGVRADVAALVAGADALRRGVPAAALTSLSETPPGELPVALVVLADLVQAGVPVDPALSVIRKALSQRRPAEEILAIPAAVLRRIREGELPGQAAEAVSRAIEAGLPWLPGIPIGDPTRVLPGGPPVPPGAGPPKDLPRPPRTPGPGGN